MTKKRKGEEENRGLEPLPGRSLRAMQEKQTDARDYQAYLIIGGKGQGKSTFLRDAVDIYLDKFSTRYEKVQPRVFIHDMSGSRAFSDIMTVEQACQQLRIKIEHPLDILAAKDRNGQPIWKSGALRYMCRGIRNIEHMYTYIAEHFKNGLLILDEWTTYVRANPPDWQIDIINNHRNWGVEVFFVCHQLMKVPLFFSRSDMLAKIILFKTGETNLTYKQMTRYSCSERLWQAYQRVEKTPETNYLVQPYEIVEV